jgi:hypothetical protein
VSDTPEPPAGERRLELLLAGMRPRLDPARYAFCRMTDGLQADRLTARGIFHETEGVTLIVETEEALRAGLTPVFLARRIELTVHSDLHAVGFLARIAQVLAASDIPCNTVSAIWHDHLYVPEALAERALAVLLALETEAALPGPPVMYAVAIRVDQAIAAEWLEWMRQVHVPEVLATGCFRRCTIQREAANGTVDGRVGFVLEYLAGSAELLTRYQREHAPALQVAHTTRYAGRFEATRSVRAVAAELPGSLA